MKLKIDKTELDFQRQIKIQESNLSQVNENYYSLSLQNFYSNYKFNLASQNDYLFFKSTFKTKGILLKAGFGKIQNNRFELGFIFANNNNLDDEAFK